MFDCIDQIKFCNFFLDLYDISVSDSRYHKCDKPSLSSILSRNAQVNTVYTFLYVFSDYKTLSIHKFSYFYRCHEKA